MKQLSETLHLKSLSEALKINSKSKVNIKDLENWTINDAEDGDIIISKYNQFIYKCLNDDKKYCSEPTAIIYHACYNLTPFHSSKPLSIGPDIGVGSLKDGNYQQFKLSSKEECKELFNALDKAGYKWNDVKLKLVKI